MHRLPRPPGRRLLSAALTALWLAVALLSPLAAGVEQHDCCRDGCADGCCLLGFKPYEPPTDGPGFTAAPTCPEDCLGSDGLTASAVRLPTGATTPGLRVVASSSGLDDDAPVSTEASWSPASPRAPPPT